MATNLAIDPRLIERALEVSGERTKKAAVTRASRNISRATSKVGWRNFLAAWTGIPTTITSPSGPAIECPCRHKCLVTGIATRCAARSARSARATEVVGRGCCVLHGIGVAGVVAGIFEAQSKQADHQLFFSASASGS